MSLIIFKYTVLTDWDTNNEGDAPNMHNLKGG